MKTEPTALGKALKRALRENNIKQIELAHALGVRTHIPSYWIHGQRVPSYEQLRRIGQLLNISGNELLGLPTPKEREVNKLLERCQQAEAEVEKWRRWAEKMPKEEDKK